MDRGVNRSDSTGWLGWSRARSEYEKGDGVAKLEKGKLVDGDVQWSWCSDCA